jgi:hypothetical protein
MADTLRLVTEEEGNLLLIAANNWLQNGPSGFMFGDVKTVAKYAVMEYLANEQGLTIYPSVLEKHEADNGSAS